MGKGRKERDIPFGQVAAQAMHRYARSVEDQRPDDPFFISYRGRRMKREDVAATMREYSRKARIEGVRCSPHTLRHAGAKRFILNGGDVFTLQKLLGHTTLVMVRRYVELASVDVRRQHERFSPADSLHDAPRPANDHGHSYCNHCGPATVAVALRLIRRAPRYARTFARIADI